MRHSYSLVEAVTTVYAHALRLRLHTSPTECITGFYNILMVNSPQRICLFVFLALQPTVGVFSQPGSGLSPPRFRGFLITHNDAPQSVGLLWTSDQSVAETSI
jgi:hypothetical protein